MPVTTKYDVYPRDLLYQLGIEAVSQVTQQHNDVGSLLSSGTSFRAASTGGTSSRPNSLAPTFARYLRSLSRRTLPERHLLP